MARNRLTWQNVNAPDYGSSMRGAEAANRMFQDALGGLNTSLGSFITNRENAQNEALLKQQQEAQEGVWRQFLAASDDPEAQVAIRKNMATLPNLGNDFMKDHLTSVRNSLITGNQGQEDYRQTILDNFRTNRDNTYMDEARHIVGGVNAFVSGGGNNPYAALSDEQRALIDRLPAEEQTRLAAAWSDEQTSNLGRGQTRQTMRHNEESQGWRRSDIQNAEAVESLRLIGMAASSDPIQQRAAMIKASSEAGLPASVVTQALQQDVGQSGGGGTGGGSPAGSPPQQGTSPQGGSSLLDESSRVSQVLASRIAAGEEPNETILGSLADDEPMAAQYERQKQQYPSVFENLTLDEYSKLFEETRRENKGLPRGTVAELMLDNYTRGTTTWDRVPRWADPLRMIKNTGNFVAPDWGRTAGVDQEAVSQAAQVLNTQLGRNTARDTHQKLNNAAASVKSGQDEVNQASAQIEAALQHYQQWGNPNVLIEADRNYELAEMNLSQLIEGFKEDEALSELFADPDNPARTITPQESRRRQDVVDRKTAETAQNRAFATATIPAVQERINQLQQELREVQMGIGLDYLAPAESIERVDELRKALEEENRRLRQLKERLQ